VARRRQNRQKAKSISLSGRFNFPKVDRVLLLLTVLLSVLGLLAVADASAPQALAVFGDSYHFAKQQLRWMILGYAALVAGASIHYKTWEKYANSFYILTVILLIIVLLPGIGNRLLGARRWISLGFFSFQPAEFAKLSLAMVVAYAASKKTDFIKILGIIGFTAALIMLQPDLGTTIVVVSIGFAQAFVAGAPLLYFLLSTLGGGALAAMLVLFSDYRRARLMTFLQSSADPLGESYHMRQILFALGSGGLFGAGIGQSRQKQLFLPETASDSVFAVMAEELGFMGSAAILVLLLFFVIRVFKIAKNAPDTFSKVLATGIGIWIGGQMFLNIASMVALIPLTGIPLPFFSYGGSSLVMILFGVGILLNISSHETK